MSNLTISIFGNQTFLKIINKLSLFHDHKILFYKDFELFNKNEIKYDQLLVFFATQDNEKDYVKLVKTNLPLIIINEYQKSQKIPQGEFIEQLSMPFKVLDFEKKIVSLLARYKFKKSELINLHEYVINQYERKIKKNNLELQLTEKEVNFLILFSKNKKPISRGYILENVWNYSSEADTHTVETHIHRLRKKFLTAFKDNNFIKNNDEGYFI